jgi:hypothetical protein
VQLTSIGSGVAVSVQTQNGLGRSIALLSDTQKVAYEKVCLHSLLVALNHGSDGCIRYVASYSLQYAHIGQSEYANKILYISTLALAKLSVISLLINITASDLHQHLGIGLTVFIALWGGISVCIGALQCGTKSPWRFIGAGSSCLSLVRSDMRARWSHTDAD